MIDLEIAQNPCVFGDRAQILFWKQFVDLTLNHHQRSQFTLVELSWEECKHVGIKF